MIVTIDGPAGSGKSSVAKLLAGQLGFHYLDTGAMYRAVTLAALQRKLSWNDTGAIARLTSQVTLEFRGDRVFLDGVDVSREIRTPRVTSAIHNVADHPQVRACLVAMQQREAGDKDIVTEGRDQGTVAFPQAECKIFLTASPSERARRRLGELRERGENASLAEVLAQQQQRDAQDESRPVGRLMKAADAIEVVTDGMSLDQVVDRLASLVREKQRILKTETA
jgi:cytidylate kinase